MGADLYIESIHDAHYEKWNPEFQAAVDARDKHAQELRAQGLNDEEVHERIADLQEKVTSAYSKVWGRENTGYFRDSYNATSVLNRCGLSWWRDVGPLCDGDGLLHPTQALVLLRRIEAEPLDLPTREQLEMNYAKVEDIGPNSVDGWHQYYREAREELMEFLKRAIRLNEPIRCSI